MPEQGDLSNRHHPCRLTPSLVSGVPPHRSRLDTVWLHGVAASASEPLRWLFLLSIGLDVL